MKSRTVAAALVAILLPLALLGVPAHSASYSNRLTNPRAHDGESAGAVDTDGYVGTRGWRSSTFMVGDSVAHVGLAKGFKPQGLAQGWEVSAVSGRDVSTLPYYLADRVQAQQPLPRVKHSKRWRRHHPRSAARRFRYPAKRVVVALGNMASPGWSYSDLRAAVNLLPSSTVVVFVTPYRDPAQWPESGPYRVRASVMRAYAAWERRIAQVRPHTCLADWRGFVQRYPSAVHDGVHASARGVLAWARIVASATDHCY